MTHRILLFALVLALLVFAHGCSTLKKIAEVGGPAAAGGAAGAAVGGPVGAGIGAAAGAVLGDAMSENDELRDGGLTGEQAKDKEIERLRLALANRPVVERSIPVEVPQPFIPAWVKWGAILAFLALKGHHIVNLFRGGGLESLMKLVGLKRTILPTKKRADTIRRLEST